MENFTDEIRNEFYEKEVLTIKDLYTKFVELSKSNIQQKSKKHKIRSVVNNLHKRGEIIRFDNGNYKKTDKIGPKLIFQEQLNNLSKEAEWCKITHNIELVSINRTNTMKYSSNAQ